MNIQLIKNHFKDRKYIKGLSNNFIQLIPPYNHMFSERIKYSEYIYIGPESYVMAKGGVEIGTNVIIGPRLSIWTENHNYKDKNWLPYGEENILKKVIIQSNVWIGYGVTICPGTVIGEGSIIGMGSVVRGNIPPLSIVIGNPAVIIGYRDSNDYNELKSKEKYYLYHKYGKRGNE